MINGYFVIFNIIKANEIQFINCRFLNLYNKKLIHVSGFYIVGEVKYLAIALINCLFHNNYNVDLISTENKFLYLSVLIQNVTVLSNIIGYQYAIKADNVALYIENIKITSNT